MYNENLDEINCTVPLDEMLGNELRHLEPHKSVFDLNEPKAVSSNLAMPKPVVASISNWFHSPEAVDPVKLSRMKELYV